MFNLQSFQQPESAYRIHPFWFWNGEMEDEQIRLQIREMAEKGLGGFFICARQGLKIPYLSDTWFQKVRVAVEAAKAYNLNAWLYDEYPYPSGIAGGEVTLEHPDAKHYTLTHCAERVSGGEHLSIELPWARIVYAKAVPLSATGDKLWHEAVDVRSAIGNYQSDPIFQKAGLTAYNQKRFFTYTTVQKIDWTAPAGEWEVIVIQEKEIEDFKYYGTFVDPCNREAMATFIRLTHDKYAQHLGEYFGNTIKGMFTDEIGLLGSIPWSPKLADFFLKRNGYDLRDHLHALLFADAEGAARVRYDYYQSVHLLLLGSYHKQVHDWCEEHGLQYVTEVPSVRATTQTYSHVPGGDTAHEKLGRSLEWILDHDAVNFRSNAKMVSSIARQMNRERNLIECFHSVGWSMTLQDAKWMIDRMAAMGTNFFNFHAFFYTLDGLTKHDAPPSQFLQNPYWQHFRHLGDYVGRISYAMSCGQADISVAVLQPTTSLWTHMGNPFHSFQYGGSEQDEKRRLEDLKRWWAAVTKGITRSGRDFDHLDAEILAQATIENGTIRIGQACYSTLVLPPLTNLETSAWSKIEAFINSGGSVISLGQLPYEVIDPGHWSEQSVRNAFALSEKPDEHFWNEAAAPLTWVKGQRNAYYLPYSASADEQTVLQALTGLLEELQPASVKLLPACGEWGLLTQTRLLSDDTALVFVSNQEETERQVTVQAQAGLWRASGQEAAGYDVEFQLLSLDNGTATVVEGQRSGASWSVPLKLASYESKLLLFKKTAAARKSAGKQPCSVQVDASAAALWKLQALSDNAVRFDTFRMSVQAQDAAKATVLEADAVPVKTFIDQCADLTNEFTLPVKMGQMFGTPMKISMSYPLDSRYSVSFAISELPEKVRLVMDQGAISGSWSLNVNGRALTAADFEPYFLYDHKNIGCDITAYLREGDNELTAIIELAHDWDGLVDALYVTGPFDVEFNEHSRPVLKKASKRELPLQAGPYAGHPYFAGTMSFSRSFEAPFIQDSDEFELTLANLDPEFHESAEVLVNGQSLGVCTWSPYRWTGPAKLLLPADNKIEVRVTNTLIGLLEGKYFNYAKHELKPVQNL